LKHTRHIEISVERHEVSVLRPNRQAIILHCEGCGTKVEMLSVESAATITGRTPRMLYRWMEEDKLHFKESPDGRILLCAKSLKTQVPTNAATSSSGDGLN
jgi:hypothetical protein